MSTKTLNKAELIGHIVNRPILETTKRGVPVTTFYVKTEREWYAGDELRVASTIHPCVAWDKLAMICSDILDAGDLVFVEGRLETKRFTDNQGVEKEISEIVLSEMKKLAKKDFDSSDVSESEPYNLEEGQDYGEEQQN